MKKLPLKLKLYLSTIYIVTAFSLYFFISSGYASFKNFDIKGIIFFILLTALTETLTVIVKSVSFSPSFAILLTSYILYGPFLAMIISILGFSLRVVKLKDTYSHILNTPLYKTFFNYCTFILLVLYSNYFYVVSGGNLSFDNLSGNIAGNALQLMIFTLVYFVLNIILIAALFTIISGRNFLYVFSNNIKLMLLNNLAMAPFGIILAFLFQAYGYVGVLIFIFPVVLARYTFSLYAESKDKYIKTVDVLMNAMEARDRYTEGHSQRVADIAEAIAKELKYNDWKLDQLKIAALMHDVGKIGIDDIILNKPGKLTDEEYETIKTHPEIGYNILKDLKDFEYVKNIVRYHHERYDGKGYPDGRKAEEIALDVFIIQLADSVDAMMTDRPYRKALTQDMVIEEVKRCSGTQFHPKVVNAYLKTL